MAISWPMIRVFQILYLSVNTDGRRRNCVAPGALNFVVEVEANLKFRDIMIWKRT